MLLRKIKIFKFTKGYATPKEEWGLVHIITIMGWEDAAMRATHKHHQTKTLNSRAKSPGLSWKAKLKIESFIYFWLRPKQFTHEKEQCVYCCTWHGLILLHTNIYNSDLVNNYMFQCKLSQCWERINQRTQSSNYFQLLAYF